MIKGLSLVLFCGLFFVVAVTAQEPQKEKKILNNADIVMMVQNHIDDETVVRVIEISETDFDISPGSLVALKSQGVSSPVLRAMLEAAQRKRPSAAPAPDTPAAANPPAPSSVPPAVPANPMGTMRGMGINPQQLAGMQSQLAAMGLGGMFGGMFSMSSYSPSQLPHVFLRAEQNRVSQEFPPSTAEVAQTKFKIGAPSAGGAALRSLATEGLSFAAIGAGPTGMIAMSAFSMASGFMPGMRPGAPSMTYVWGLPGRKSSRELANPDPIFQLNYGDIPGVDPDAFEPAIIKLFQTKDNYRLVGATRTKLKMKNMMSGSGPESGKWISEERWPTRVYKEERGFYILRVNQPLEPAEYAVVLRPVKHYKGTASGLGGHAQVFYSVWDFSVPGAVPEDAGKKKKR